MWQVMKIQRKIGMMKIEPGNLTGRPEKVGVKRAKFCSESHFCKEKHSEVTRHSVTKIDTKFDIHKFAHL